MNKKFKAFYLNHVIRPFFLFLFINIPLFDEFTVEFIIQLEKERMIRSLRGLRS